jgi:hypothetical protein
MGYDLAVGLLILFILGWWFWRAVQMIACKPVWRGYGIALLVLWAPFGLALLALPIRLFMLLDGFTIPSGGGSR